MLLVLICCIFPALLLFAAWHDVKTMTIPNWVSIALALAYIPAAALAGVTSAELGLHLAIGALALLACAVLFYLGVFGGGDAKLIAAVTVWTGMGASLPFALHMAVWGGGLAFLLIAARRFNKSPALPWLKRLMSPGEGAPYAVAIALGALTAAPQAPVLAEALRLAGA